MRHLLLIILSVAGSTCSAQVEEVVTANGQRIIRFEDAGENELRALLINRVETLGYNQWPLPQSSAVEAVESRPRKVADCPNLPLEYVAPSDVPSTLELEARHLMIGRAHFYEFMAYENALTESDCTCTSLVGDWNRAVRDFEVMRADLTVPATWTAYTVWSQTLIKNDYDRMCDITLTIDME